MDTMLHSVEHQSRWLFFLQGLLSIVFGVLLLVWPGETLAVMIRLFGWLVLLAGVFGLVGAIASVNRPHGWGWRIAAGILGILAGIVILKWPAPTLALVVLFIGAWAISLGILDTIHAVASADDTSHAWLRLAGGFITILFGALVLFWPAIGLMTLIYIGGVYAIIYGIIACAGAFLIHGVHPDVAGGKAAYQ
jgi:uncharacterized membrane protein HdeD (DUF308 family)